MNKFFTALSLSALLTLAIGCADTTPQATVPDTRITYSNLAEDEVQQELAAVMTEAGISEARQAVFFDHVNQFNGAVSPEALTQGFETRDFLTPKYDPYDLQEEWEAAYPLFLGYNCRITAYGLFGDFVNIPADAPVQADTVLLDLSALEVDPSAFPRDLRGFSVLFSSVPTTATKDVATHVTALQENWAERGITFRENDKASLITVLFHAAEEENNSLFIGHTGILFPQSDGSLLFVEKLAFQQPYQYTRFPDRTALSDYMMLKYDTDVGQPTAPPFIMENDQLMEGYRPTPAVESAAS